MTKYRNHEITCTNNTTDTARGVRHTYAISGPVVNHNGAQRPFLTSLSAAREHIEMQITARSNANN